MSAFDPGVRRCQVNGYSSHHSDRKLAFSSYLFAQQGLSAQKWYGARGYCVMLKNQELGLA